MAIININANLNGGDDTTPDNELFYRIYGDVDAYTTPIHTTGTAIADADVTVTGDVVDISNVDGTTNTSFKIAAVDGAGNEGILSDAVSGSIIIFQDDFAGTVIDAQWTKVILNASDSNITQDDEILLEQFGNADQANRETYLIATNPLPLSAVTCYSFDFQSPVQNSTQAGVLLYDTNPPTGYQNRIGVSTGVLDDIFFQCTEDGVNKTTLQPTVDYTTARTFKIKIDGISVTLSVWDGSWSLLGTFTLDNAFTETFYPYIEVKDKIGNVNIYTVDNMFMTNEDFATQYPI